MHYIVDREKSKVNMVKKSCRATFLVVQRSTLQWNDDMQILEGQSSGGKENQAPGKQD